MRGGKGIVIIGANEFQEPLIRKASREGLETHVFAWERGAVARAQADFFYPFSIVEKERILEECRRIRPAAVVTAGSDLAAVTVNYLAQRLGLPGNPPETAVLAVNKYEMRKALRDAGLPTPPFFRLRSSSKAELAGLLESGFPLVIKPSDRSGSRGVSLVRSEEGLARAVDAAIGCSFSREAVAEGYIEGNEFSCESISYGGRHQLLQVTAKFTTGAPHFIETGHVEPSGLPREAMDRLVPLVFRTLDALHVREGAAHTEVRIDSSGRIGIIESGARMGGDCIGSDLVPLTTGFDYVGMILDTALGRPPRMERGGCFGAAGIRFLMDGDDAAEFRRLEAERPDLLIRRYVEDGPVNLAPVDSSTRHGFYILAGADADEIRRRVCGKSGR